MKRDRKLHQALYALIATAAMLAYFICPNEPRPPRPGKPAAQTPNEFVRATLTPIFGEIEKKYPVGSVRRTFRSMVKMKKKRHPWVMAEEVGPGSLTATRGGDANIYFFVPNLMEAYELFGDREEFKDVLLLASLQAFFELDAEARGSADPALRRSAASWYLCERIIEPMVKAGRLKKFLDLQEPAFRETIRTYRAYQQAAGNPKHPAWRKYLERFEQPRHPLDFKPRRI